MKDEFHNIDDRIAIRDSPNWQTNYPLGPTLFDFQCVYCKEIFAEKADLDTFDYEKAFLKHYKERHVTKYTTK